MSAQDVAWFREQIEAIFGNGAQSACARFPKEAGDLRSHGTILRSISNHATGSHGLSGEPRVLLSRVQHPERIDDIIRRIGKAGGSLGQWVLGSHPWARAK